VRPAPTLGEVCAVMVDHVTELVAHYERLGFADADSRAAREFRKHTGWYLTGYPVGPDLRRRFAEINGTRDVARLVADVDPATVVVDGGERLPRGHTNGPIHVVLPHGYLDHLDDLVAPDDDDVMAMSGG